MSKQRWTSCCEILQGGVRKGEVCGKKVEAGMPFCKDHMRGKNVSNFIAMQEMGLPLTEEQQRQIQQYQDRFDAQVYYEKYTSREIEEIKASDRASVQKARDKIEKCREKSLEPVDPVEGLEQFLPKVLEKVHPDSQLSSEANEYIQQLLLGLVPRLDQTQILDGLLDGSIMGVIPGDLGTHADREGLKVLTRKTAKLVFSPDWTQEIFQSDMTESTAKFVAAVFEYLTAEILEIAGNAARDSRRSEIHIGDVQRAIRADAELQELFQIPGLNTEDAVEGLENLFSRVPSESMSMPAPTMQQLLNADLQPLLVYSERDMTNLMRKWKDSQMIAMLWIFWYAAKGRLDKVMEYRNRHAIDFGVLIQDKIRGSLIDSSTPWNEGAISLLEHWVF